MSSRTYRNVKATATKRSRSVSVKRRHRPLNRYEMEQDEESTCASAKKLKSKETADIHVDPAFGYRFVNFLAVFSALSEVVKCKTCDSNVKFMESSIRGLGFKLLVVCDKCEATAINSCPLINGKAYDVNKQIVFAFRLLGIGLTGIEKFCGVMDLPKPIFRSFYDKIVENVHCAAKTVGELSMLNAVKEEKAMNEKEGNKEGLTVSGDGTWQKRGFSSLHGVATLIGHYSGKVVDLVVKSAYCKACEYWKQYSSTNEYQIWQESHSDSCTSNHEDSAGKMEVDAIKEMFARSEKQNGVRYTSYIGDGDSKTQNNNESVNAMVWSMAPKSQFCGNKIVETASYIAASIFNDGYESVLKIMQVLNLKVGTSCYQAYQARDELRISCAQVRARASTKEGREARRALRKEAADLLLEKEGPLYGSGIAD